MYGSLFDFPLTADEVLRFSRGPQDKGEVERILREELSEQVFEIDGLFGLRGREASVPVRQANTEAVELAWKTARRRARIIGWTPFVAGLMVTGSLSHDNFAQDADIDYLVLVDPGRIFTVFAVLGTVQRLTSVKTLCPNYYLATDRMALPELDYFIGREILASTPVLGPRACEQFQDANRWAWELFPSAPRKPASEAPPAGNVITRSLRWLLSGRLGDWMEARFQKMLITRLDAHYALCGVPLDQTVVREAQEGFRLRFHARLHREKIQARLESELARLGVEDPGSIVRLADRSA